MPEHESDSQTAVVEFESHEDALYAKSKEAKPFQGRTLEITIGTRATLWVTNFPPTADEKWVHELFAQVRSDNIAENISLLSRSLLFNFN